MNHCQHTTTISIITKQCTAPATWTVYNPTPDDEPHHTTMCDKHSLRAITHFNCHRERI